MSDIYQCLRDLDQMLKDAVDSTESCFDKIDNLSEASLVYAQKQVDAICEKISSKINSSLDKKKKEAIKIISSKYKQQLKALEVFKPIIDLMSLNISLDNIVTVVKNVIVAFARPYIKPYEDAVAFVRDVTTKVTPLVASITINASKLALLPTKILSKISSINPKLNANKLNISFTPPTIDDFIS